MKLPPLYKLTRTGADQIWEIWTEGNTICTRWGQIGGAMQDTRDTVSSGKNVGRSNETLPTEQAQAEAKSRWEKKLKKGYVKDLGSAQRREVDSVIQGGVFPMLAQDFSKHPDKLTFPCFGQPKFDGHRCIAVVDSIGLCTLWTRSRKPITSMNHICAEIESLGLFDVVLDGELYNHDYHDRFEDLSSYIRDSSAKEGSTDVQYHVYDVIREGTFAERHAWLNQNLKQGAYLKRVDTICVDDESCLLQYLEDCISDGYEGCMARNESGVYQQNGRSYDLLKVKQFDDAEYKVVGVKGGRGKLANHAIFTCETDKGTNFDVKMMGETESLKQYFDDPSLAIGRSLTVKFQGITKKNGVPRFPVGLRFRDDP